MTELVFFLLGAIAILFSMLIAERLIETPANKRAEQHNLEPWQVAEQWHNHILGEK
ncbi:hypothetical protein ACJQWY_01175 [Weissella kandleri]|uniref:hypothetical protein n=1 Tax=Weissella kandleri TaxID=1616 RepID=UPI00387E4ED8